MQSSWNCVLCITCMYVAYIHTTQPMGNSGSYLPELLTRCLSPDSWAHGPGWHQRLELHQSPTRSQPRPCVCHDCRTDWPVEERRVNTLQLSHNDKYVRVFGLMCVTCLWTLTPSSSGTLLKSVMRTRPSTSLWERWTLPSIRYTFAFPPSSAPNRGCVDQI